MKTKVAHVVTAYSSVVTILRGKLAALADYDDLQVTVISGPPESEHANEEPPIRHLTVPMARAIRPLKDWRSVHQLQHVFQEEKFDVVHSHTAKAGVIAATAARRAHVPLILHTYHGLPFDDRTPWPLRSTYRWMEKRACRSRHHVFSQNHYDISQCVALMGGPNLVSYEGNGVDIAALESEAATNRERARDDFPNSQFRILMISRLEPVKRVGDFLAVCRRLLDAGMPCSGAIAGTGCEEPRLRRQLQTIRLEHAVRMLGWCSHTPSLIAESDVVVLTSEREGIPRSLMEAMALGKPVVAARAGGTAELVLDKVTGLLAPVGDTNVLAQCIIQLMEDRSLCERLGQAGRQRIIEHFNDSKIAAMLHNFYVHTLHRQ